MTDEESLADMCILLAASIEDRQREKYPSKFGVQKYMGLPVREGFTDVGGQERMVSELRRKRHV